MEAVNYKTLTTSRGFTYSYFLGKPSEETIAELDPADPPLPALLFLHGFPTSSRLWRHQVEFFVHRGFVVIVPDLLGFGETSKPTEVECYRSSLVCKDVVEILDAEVLQDVIAIGHDLGSKIVSRLANFYPDRFKAYGFLAAPYYAPRPKSNIEFTSKLTKKMCGYELCGHTVFYSEDGSDKLIENQLDSFFSVLFPSDPKVRVTHVAPIGALRSWLEHGRKAEMGPWIPPKDMEYWRTVISRDGIAGALCWHKGLVSGVNADDDKPIPLELYHVAKPVLFAAATHDYISPAILGIATTNYHCKTSTIRQFNEGHWLMLSAPAELNVALLSWVMDCI
ncbi:Alpha/Beta hydrolase protein [Gymnopilus junonius]|uniref:Alpha/Beta hydrolase protein n=1 Tax=Gymnopilus junonius TaxID=109634 RepID=A0A9P5NXS6_GYMJU|nr:Alpha/Beta hydrolase protein [Gymnopilus junonius]